MNKRLCIVNGEFGYFHTWEENNGKSLYGIVEFTDGIRRVEPTQIRFADEENHALYKMNEDFEKEESENEGE